ncbi:MAG: (2Fe-2S)-binding protein [Bradyrhizobiaceae bacterium]|nr:(2Fe-2S)-binding protein [Bradyrhizobiaceae bacterium]
MSIVKMTLNGSAMHAEVEARTSLADFLREQLNLTATHLACEHGVCGACTVLLNGEPVRGCLTLAIACEGVDVRTFEGLRDDRVMHALVQSFHENHGLQCGFCTPAMLVTARDLILRGKATSDQEVRLGISGNLCRCTGYTSIVDSVRKAAEALGSTQHRPSGSAVGGS